MPFHIVHFSPSTLETTLTREGFTNAQIRQITPSLWVASSVIARMFARRGHPTRQLRNPFLVLALMLIARLVFFPLLILGNRCGRGDCLIAIATAERSSRGRSSRKGITGSMSSILKGFNRIGTVAAISGVTI